MTLPSQQGPLQQPRSCPPPISNAFRAYRNFASFHDVPRCLRQHVLAYVRCRCVSLGTPRPRTLRQNFFRVNNASKDSH
eukprot:224219-Pleurochrysis_carterae.AAC.3